MVMLSCQKIELMQNTTIWGKMMNLEMVYEQLNAQWMVSTNNTGKTKSRLCGDASELLSDSVEEVGDILSSVVNWAGGTNFLPLDLLSLGSQITPAKDGVASVSSWEHRKIGCAIVLVNTHDLHCHTIWIHDILDLQ